MGQETGEFYLGGDGGRQKIFFNRRFARPPTVVIDVESEVPKLYIKFNVTGVTRDGFELLNTGINGASFQWKASGPRPFWAEGVRPARESNTWSPEYSAGVEVETGEPERESSRVFGFYRFLAILALIAGLIWTCMQIVDWFAKVR